MKWNPSTIDNGVRSKGKWHDPWPILGTQNETALPSVPGVQFLRIISLPSNSMYRIRNKTLLCWDLALCLQKPPFHSWAEMPCSAWIYHPATSYLLSKGMCDIYSPGLTCCLHWSCIFLTKLHICAETNLPLIPLLWLTIPHQKCTQSMYTDQL